MGKKKSKVAKKKQAKAASRAKQAKGKTTAFGVSVVKGSKGRGTSSSSDSTAGPSNKSRSMAHTATKNRSGFGGRNDASTRGRHVAAKDNERNDFDLEYASLQERAGARQRQQKAGGKNRGNRKHHHQMQQQQEASSLFSDLAQSSIKLGPATVGEMVDDAADRVAAGMTTIGAALSPVGGAVGPTAPPNTPSGSSNLLQVLAAKKRQEWSAQKYMLQAPDGNAGEDQMGNNRFASLDNGDSDSDDNGWGVGGRNSASTPPAFQFARASFALRPERAGRAQPDSDDDPDL
jgi:hypothetical protein